MNVIGSIFEGSGKPGDFGWMIEQPEHDDSLFIFNDNEEHFLAFRKNPKGKNACERGGGNAVVRPYQCKVPQRAIGIPTGAKQRGYNKLTAHVKQVIDDAIATIRRLVGTGRYQRVIYSAKNAAGDLGTGIFEVGDDVKNHIAAEIKKLGDVRTIGASAKFTFFYKGHFSQFYASPFTVGECRFSHAEQFMMYSKAVLFGDIGTAKQILQAATPDEQKALGRKTAGFNDEIWKLFREGIVFTGNYAKFSQNPELRAGLLATRGTTLVEAAPRDLIWGIGLAADDPRASDRSKWRGSNLLGEILCRVREVLIWEEMRAGT
jgi:ribA/ribD-fused uncharacterized protein